MGFENPNCHDAESEASMNEPALVVLSAPCQASLEKSIREHSSYIRSNPAQIRDIAYTLCNRREGLPVRSFAVVTDPEDIEFLPPLAYREAPKIVMIFSGQGTQWAGMAKELMERYSSFDADIQSLGAILHGLEDPAPWDLKEELLKAADVSNIDNPEYSQPLLAAIQIALVNFLAALGVVPDSVIGFSSGEKAAAYASGAITAAEAIIAAYYCGEVVKQLDQGKGGMAVVGLSYAQVQPFLKPGVMVGCDPSPQQTVLSGDTEPLDRVCEDIRKAKLGVFCFRLPSRVAYHSHHMLKIGQAYETLLAPHIHSKAPTIPFYSSVNAELVSAPGSLDASYWRQNLETPVLFNKAMKRMTEEQSGSRIFIEISAHGSMRLVIPDYFTSEQGHEPDTYFPVMSRGKNCDKQLLKLVGELFIRNVLVDFDALAPKGTTLTDLPQGY